MSKIIEIVYIVTGSYCEYAKKFFETIKYFAPGTKKIVTILSNGLEDYKNYCEGDVIATRYFPIFDLIYPCINLHKNYFIEQLPKTGADYIFYFDADTIFKEVPNYNWEKMFSDLDSDYVVISKHPMYAAKDDFKLCGITKKAWIDNFFTENMTEKDETRSGYIPAERYDYLISSFFAANNRVMGILNNRIVLMTRSDLTRYPRYHIPKFMDENYFNALAYDDAQGIDNDGLKFKVEQYSELWNGNNNNFDTVFIYQKNMPDFKKNRR